MPPTDDDVRARLVELPPATVDVDADLAMVHARAHRRRRQRRGLAVGCVALALALAGAGIVLAAGSGNDHQPRRIVAEPASIPSTTAPSTTALTTTAPTTTLVPPEVEQLPPSAVTDYSLPSGAGSALAVGGGSVWVGGAPTDQAPCHVGCGRVLRIDPDSGAVVATITVEKYPRAMAFGFGALWVEAEMPDNSPALVLKIDAATDEVVARVEIPNIVVVGSTGHPRLAVGAGAVWVGYGVQLTKIDPDSDTVVGDGRLDFEPDGGIVADDSGVWAVGVAVEAIDPTTLEPRQVASLPAGFVQSSTLDGDTIWLTEAHNPPQGGTDPVLELIEVDTMTGEVTFTGIPTYNVAAGGGRVWFQGFAGVKVSGTHPGYAVEVDPATGRMRRAALIDLASITSPRLAVDARDVWLLHDTTLIRIRT
jgi:hypothetical protein